MASDKLPNEDNCSSAPMIVKLEGDFELTGENEMGSSPLANINNIAVESIDSVRNMIRMSSTDDDVVLAHESNNLDDDDAQHDENIMLQLDTSAADDDPQSEERSTPQKSTTKRVRRFQMTWKVKYPWIDYIGESDLFNGVMVCTICREYSEHADISSKFLHGTNTFRLGAIDSHNISRGHKNCVAKKLMETMYIDKSMENLLKMSEERSTLIRLRRKQREKTRKKKNINDDFLNGLINTEMGSSCDQANHVLESCDQEMNASVGSDDNLITKQPTNHEGPTADSPDCSTPKKPRMTTDGSKRIRRFLWTWKKEYPWLDYFGDDDLLNGIMVCKMCRLLPEIADQTSSFFSGSSSFRKDGIESHNISAGHRACLATCQRVLQQTGTVEKGQSSQTDYSTDDYEPRASDIQTMKEYFSQIGVLDINNSRKDNDYQLDLPSTSDQCIHSSNDPVHSQDNLADCTIPMFHAEWTTLFPWVTYSCARDYTPGEMFCMICRLHPEVADLNSELFKGTRTFEKCLLQQHMDSRPHKLCVARQLYDQSLADDHFHVPLQKTSSERLPQKQTSPEGQSSQNHTSPGSMSSQNRISPETLSQNKTTPEPLSPDIQTYPEALPPDNQTSPDTLSQNQSSQGPSIEISHKPFTPMFRRYNKKCRNFEVDQQEGNSSRLHVDGVNNKGAGRPQKELTNVFDPAWKGEFIWLDYECVDLTDGIMFCKLCRTYPDDASTSELLHGTRHFSREQLVEHGTSTGHRAAVCRNFLALLAKEKESSGAKTIAPASSKDFGSCAVSKKPVNRQMIKRAASMEEFNKMRDKAKSAIDDSASVLNTISQEIWSNPELAYKEHHAHKILTDFLEKQGFEVQRKYILDTAFRATWGTDGGVTIGVLCEYDALPGIGHACGHNLIAECGVATAIGIKAALEMNIIKDLNAKIVVLGTPAEESGGGKCKMIEEGAFDGLDVALMAHPYAYNVSRPNALSMLELKITYHGKSAHAAAAPWEGINALDAAITCYTSLSNLRQQIKPDWRLHGIITNGGLQANIIPDKAELSYYFRAPDEENLAVLKEKAIACIEGAAKTTGCEVEIKQSMHYKNLVTNTEIISLYEKHAENLGIHFGESIFTHGSTDMGNVTYVVPGIHPQFDIVTDAPIHSTKFTQASGAAEAQGPTLIQAKALALTALEIVHPGNEGILQNIRKEFQDTMKAKQPSGAKE